MKLSVRLFPILLIAIVTTPLLFAQQTQPAYRFTAGQKLYYQRTIETSDPVFNNAYIQTQECQIAVDRVDTKGNATITLTVLKDTLIMRTADESAIRSITLAQLQPKIRFTISPTGTITPGMILTYSEQLLNMQRMAQAGGAVAMISDSQRIMLEAGQWLPPLPRFAGNNPVVLDTMSMVMDIPVTNDSAGMPGLVVEPRVASGIVTHRLVGSRGYGGVDCQLIVKSELQRRPLANDALLHRQEFAQHYFRRSDGLPVHLEGTLVSLVTGEGVGLVRRMTQNMIGTW